MFKLEAYRNGTVTQEWFFLEQNDAVAQADSARNGRVAIDHFRLYKNESLVEEIVGNTTPPPVVKPIRPSSHGKKPKNGN